MYFWKKSVILDLWRYYTVLTWETIYEYGPWMIGIRLLWVRYFELKYYILFKDHLVINRKSKKIFSKLWYFLARSRILWFIFFERSYNYFTQIIPLTEWMLMAMHGVVGWSCLIVFHDDADWVSLTHIYCTKRY